MLRQLICHVVEKDFNLSYGVHQEDTSGKYPRSEMRRRRPNPVDGCPLTAALAVLGGKWKLIIMYWLTDSPKHFAALRQAMPGISQKVLTQQLRELLSDELVHRIHRAQFRLQLSIRSPTMFDRFCP